MQSSGGDPAPRDQHGDGPSVPIVEYRRPGATLAKGPSPRRILATVVVGALLLPVTLLIAYPVARLLPFGWEAVALVEVPTDRPGKYGGTAAFHITARGTGRGAGTRLESGYIVYSGRDEHFSIPAVDVQRMRFAHDYYLPVDRPLDRTEMLKKLSDGGFDPSSAEAMLLADQITAEVRKLRDGQLPTDRTGEPYPLATPCVYYQMAGTYWIDLGEYGALIWLPWYAPFCVPVWLLASVLAGRRMLRRTRTGRER